MTNMANGIPVVSDCRLSSTQGPWLIPPGVRVSSATPREGCDCDACTNGREDKARAIWTAIDDAARCGGKAAP